MSVFQVKSDGGVVQTVDFRGILGYYKEYMCAFWGKLSKEQKNRALIISKETLSTINCEIMPRIMELSLTGQRAMVKLAYKDLWEDLKRSAVQPEWFEKFSNGEPVKGDPHR